MSKTASMNANNVTVILSGTLNGTFTGPKGTMLKYIIKELGDAVKTVVFRDIKGRPVSLDRKIEAPIEVATVSKIDPATSGTSPAATTATTETVNLTTAAKSERG